MSDLASCIQIPKLSARYPSELINRQFDWKAFADIPYVNETKQLISILEKTGCTLKAEPSIFSNPNSQFYEFNRFLISNTKVPLTPRLLGYTAEGIIVRDCNKNISENKKWANFARFHEGIKPFSIIRRSMLEPDEGLSYDSIVDNLDDYIAVGTGFISTRIKHYQYYNTLSDRDIIWIKKTDEYIQLKNIIKLHSTSQRYAGLQVKVSCGNDGRYIINYFARKPAFSLYPVVYFDLGGDFIKVRDSLLNQEEIWKKPNSLFGVNVKHKEKDRLDILSFLLIQGKEIAPSLHEELLYYKKVFEDIELSKIKLSDLENEEIILSLIINYFGSSYIDKRIKVKLMTLAV